MEWDGTGVEEHVWWMLSLLKHHNTEKKEKVSKIEREQTESLLEKEADIFTTVNPGGRIWPCCPPLG